MLGVTMAKKTTKRHYEMVYKDLREVAHEAMRAFGDREDAPFMVACAQAEALVRTLRAYTLRAVRKNAHAGYLHYFFTELLQETLHEMPHLRGMLLVKEQKPKKKGKVSR